MDNSRIGLRWLACLMLTVSGIAAAGKCGYISLAELVRESDLIALGDFEPETPGRAIYSTTFKVDEFLMGEVSVPGHELVVCRGGCPDSPELGQLKGRYLAFFSKRGQCLVLLHGYISMVKVSEETADTWAIAGEPDTQAFQDLLRKIRSFIDSSGSHRTQGPGQSPASQP